MIWVTTAGLLMNLFLLVVSGYVALRKEFWGCYFLAALNSFLFFQNLMPFPGSDGEQLLRILIFEGMIDLRQDQKLIGWLMVWSGTITILSLGIMFYLFLKDLVKIE